MHAQCHDCVRNFEEDGLRRIFSPNTLEGLEIEVLEGLMSKIPECLTRKQSIVGKQHLKRVLMFQLIVTNVFTNST